MKRIKIDSVLLTELQKKRYLPDLRYIVDDDYNVVYLPKHYTNPNLKNFIVPNITKTKV